MKKFMLFLVALLVVGAGAFGWYYLYGPCGTQQVARAGATFQPIIDDFSDAVDLANSTARGSLPDRISQLQDIKSQAGEAQVPACMNTSKTLLVKSMEATIDGFIAFMAEQDDSTVSSFFSSANNYLTDATNEMERVQACAPFCIEDPYRVIP